MTELLVRELTEEEILKAPEKDYMNEAQLLFFKKQLLELRDQLLQNADDTGEHLRENEVTTDPSDRATLEEAARCALTFPHAFGFTLRYAMKANPSRGVLSLFRELGLHIDASSPMQARKSFG